MAVGDPLIKKGIVDGARPTAVGEVWLHIVAVCAMEACPTKGLSLLPLQCCVGMAGGAQCVGHAVTAGALAHPDHLTLQIDFKNTFNSLCWAFMLRAVRKCAHGLANFAAFIHSKHGELLVRIAVAGSPLEGKPGSQQSVWS